MSQRVVVSFKTTTKDSKLFNFLDKQEEKSDFVKRALRYYIKYHEGIELERE